MKFRAEPWGSAFIKAAGTVSNAEEALECLRVYCRAALTLPGDLSGRNDADRLGQCIAAALASGGKAVKKMPETGLTDAADLASRFIQLMLRKSCFYQYKEITREIEKAIYRQKGIEEVIVETAVESDEAGSSGEEIFAMVKEEALRLTRAKDVKLISRVIPDLLGGIRLRWGSIVIDGSIKQRLEKMAGDIGALNGYLEQGLEA